MPTIKKAHKMDKHLVSNQPWELQYIAKKYEVSTEDVKLAKKIIGTSRPYVYKLVRAVRDGKIVFNQG